MSTPKIVVLNCAVTLVVAVGRVTGCRGASVVPGRSSGEGAPRRVLNYLIRNAQVSCPPTPPPATLAAAPMAAVISAKRPRALTNGVEASGVGRNDRVGS